MTVVKYTEDDTGKKYVPSQALLDGWGMRVQSLDDLVGIELVDRENGRNTVVISNVEEDFLIGMIFVYFKAGGWLVLDSAINQFERKI